MLSCGVLRLQSDKPPHLDVRNDTPRCQRYATCSRRGTCYAQVRSSSGATVSTVRYCNGRVSRVCMWTYHPWNSRHVVSSDDVSPHHITACTPVLSLISHRKLHGERQELIRQWDEAMDAMKQRDGAILVGALGHFNANTHAMVS